MEETYQQRQGKINHLNQGQEGKILSHIKVGTAHIWKYFKLGEIKFRSWMFHPFQNLSNFLKN